MPQADFAYAPANDAAGTPLAVSVFADRSHVRDQIGEDASAAGLALRECGSVAALLEGEPRPLGEVVLLDTSGFSTSSVRLRPGSRLGPVPSKHRSGFPMGRGLPTGKIRAGSSRRMRAGPAPSGFC